MAANLSRAETEIPWSSQPHKGEQKRFRLQLAREGFGCKDVFKGVLEGERVWADGGEGTMRRTDHGQGVRAGSHGAWRQGGGKTGNVQQQNGGMSGRSSVSRRCDSTSHQDGEFHVVIFLDNNERVLPLMLMTETLANDLGLNHALTHWQTLGKCPQVGPPVSHPGDAIID